MVVILTDNTTVGQSGPGSNGNEGVFRITQSFRAGTAPSDSLVSYTEHSFVVVVVVVGPAPFVET